MKTNILIVDDVLTSLALMSGIVKSEGYIARPVQNVKQAMEAIDALLPDLILSDVSMPDIDGYEFCEMVKSNPKTADIPLIFVSALNDVNSRKKGYNVGAVDFIVKPFDFDEVRLRINTQIKNLVMQRELEEYNKRLHRMMNTQIAKITDDQRYLIYGLVRLAESREDPTGTHMINVSVNSAFLAQSLQLSPEYEKYISNNFIDDIGLAAPLHDIGSLTISDRILLKRGKLTADEMTVMRTHAEIGARTLTEVYRHNEFSRYLGMAIDIAYYHHEKWDGSGYPKGLKGKGIPMSARIFSLVDVYDTLTRDKCYRDAYTHDEAIEIIKEESGKSFDPGIVDIFMKILSGIRRN